MTDNKNAAADLAAQLSQLEQSAQERYEYNKEAMEKAREMGQAEAEGLFGAGTLGRIREETAPELLQLIEDRQQQVRDIEADTGPVQAREAEINRIRNEFTDLLAASKDTDVNQMTKLAREQGQVNIDRQLRGNLKNMAALSNQSNLRTNAALTQDAYKQSLYATGDLERQLLLDRLDMNQKALGLRKDIATSGAGAISEAMRQKENVIDRQREQINQQRSRLEEINMLKEQDILARQQFNLAQASQEKYGRLSLEEGRVGQELAALSSARSESLSEMSYVNQKDYQDEQLEIQRIEANKEPPKASGGKSLLCIQYWLTGDLTDEVLKGDFEYTAMTPSIDEDVKLTYYTWSAEISPYVLKKGLVYEILKPYVVNWANNMACKVSESDGYLNPVGAFMEYVGVPLYRGIGKILGRLGYSLEAIEQDPQFTMLTTAALPIYNQAMQSVEKPRKFEWIKELPNAA